MMLPSPEVLEILEKIHNAQTPEEEEYLAQLLREQHEKEEREHPNPFPEMIF